jgi:hypothetical protein
LSPAESQPLEPGANPRAVPPSAIRGRAPSESAKSWSPIRAAIVTFVLAFIAAAIYAGIDGHAYAAASFAYAARLD